MSFLNKKRSSVESKSIVSGGFVNLGPSVGCDNVRKNEKKTVIIEYKGEVVNSLQAYYASNSSWRDYSNVPVDEKIIIVPVDKVEESSSVSSPKPAIELPEVLSESEEEEICIDSEVSMECSQVRCDEVEKIESDLKLVTGFRVTQGGMIVREHDDTNLQIYQDVLVGGMPRRVQQYPGKFGAQSPGRGRYKRPEQRRLKKTFKKKRGNASFGDAEFMQPSNRITRAVIGPSIPDEFREDYRYIETQKNVFNTANTTGAVYWRMNSMEIIVDGGSQAVIPDWFITGMVGSARFYRRYRVLSSFVTVRVRNRELVNPLEVLLFTSQTNSTVTTNAEYVYRAAQQYCVRRQLGPAGAMDAKATLKMGFHPSKFFGKQYHEQDEYSGSIAVAGPGSPTSLVYWGLAFLNANTNTVTTGGLSVSFEITNRVLVYQVDRDEDSASLIQCTFKDGCVVPPVKIEEEDLSEEDKQVLSKFKKLTIKS